MEIDYPDGGKTIFSYTPTQTSQHKYQNASAYEDLETLYDSYGRQSRVAIFNGQSGNDWYQQDTCYNTNGNVQFQSYRYQSTGFVASKVCSGSGDTYRQDELRPNKVHHSWRWHALSRIFTPVARPRPPMKSAQTNNPNRWAGQNYRNLRNFLEQQHARFWLPHKLRYGYRGNRLHH